MRGWKFVMPLYVLYRAAAVSILAGELDGAGNQPEVCLPVLDLTPGGVQFPAQAEVEREIWPDVPIVLEERREDVGALAPGAAVDAATDLGGQPEHEVGFRDAAAGSGSGQRIRTGTCSGRRT